MKGWIGITPEGVWKSGLPSATWETSDASEPPADGTLKAAIGGLGCLKAPGLATALATVVNNYAPSGKAYPLRKVPSAFIGWDDTSSAPDSPSAKVVFVMVKKDARSDFNPEVDLVILMQNIERSGADMIYSLDGGASVGLAHRNRLGNDLATIGEPAVRHSGWGATFFNYVNNYVISRLED